VIITITDYWNRVWNTVSCAITMISCLTYNWCWWISLVERLANSIWIKWITISTSNHRLRWEAVSITIWCKSRWTVWWEWICNTVLHAISIRISLKTFRASTSCWNLNWNWWGVWGTAWACCRIIFCSSFCFDFVSHSACYLSFHAYLYL